MPNEALPQPKTIPLLNGGNIQHGFFTRKGGVSMGIYAGLNIGIGSNDDQRLVTENRRRAAAHFHADVASLLTPWQVHSADAIIVDGPFQGERPKADGIVTATPGLAIGVVTADCGPILFSDPKAGVIGAAHAGWKGALNGVLENTIAAMEELGAKRGNICAALGPCISQKNYEVGTEYRTIFTGRDPSSSRFFVPSVNAGHSLFDLWSYIVHRLDQAGVKPGLLGDCTYADEANYFSYRRTTHRKEPDYGRQISAISIRRD